MGLSLVYLAGWFGYRILEFFRHWYINAFLKISHRIITLLERLDRHFAFKITLRNFFRPLYQDYTVIGYLMGFFFRFWRIFFAAIVYGIIIVVAGAVYVLWAGFPLYLIFRGIL